jgi:hypothetical protein
MRRRNNHFGSRGEPPVDFVRSGLMVFMPRAYGCDHTARIRKKSRRHA